MWKGRSGSSQCSGSSRNHRQLGAAAIVNGSFLQPMWNGTPGAPLPVLRQGSGEDPALNTEEVEWAAEGADADQKEDSHNNEEGGDSSGADSSQASDLGVYSSKRDGSSDKANDTSETDKGDDISKGDDDDSSKESRKGKDGTKKCTSKLMMCQVMKWGLIPSYTKPGEEKQGYNLINARSEGVTQSPIWRRLINKRRCVILIHGFYEWKRTQQMKQPFYVTVDAVRMEEKQKQDLPLLEALLAKKDQAPQVKAEEVAVPASSAAVKTEAQVKAEEVAVPASSAAVKTEAQVKAEEVAVPASSAAVKTEAQVKEPKTKVEAFYSHVKTKREKEMHENTEWACGTCTLLQTGSASACSLCATPRLVRTESTGGLQVEASSDLKSEVASGAVKTEDKGKGVVDTSNMPLMKCAGIFDTWYDKETDKNVYTCAVLTTASNQDFDRIHERMPVVLSEAGAKIWLNRAIPFADCQQLCLPYE
eukprot:g72344.t1